MPNEANYRVLYLDENGADVPPGNRPVLVVAGPIFVVEFDFGDVQRIK